MLLDTTSVGPKPPGALSFLIEISRDHRMSIRFAFDPTSNMLFTRAERVLSVRALTQHFAEKTAEELVDVPELFEAADAVIAVTEADAREFVRAGQGLRAGHRFAPVAIVVRDKHFYRMVSFAAALYRLGSAPNMAVFDAYGSALDWLLRYDPFSNRPKRNGTRDT